MKITSKGAKKSVDEVSIKHSVHQSQQHCEKNIAGKRLFLSEVLVVLNVLFRATELHRLKIGLK